MRLPLLLQGSADKDSRITEGVSSQNLHKYKAHVLNTALLLWVVQHLLVQALHADHWMEGVRTRCQNIKPHAVVVHVWVPHLIVSV